MPYYNMFFAYFTLQHKKLICLHLGLKLVFINKIFLYLKKYFQNWWDRMIQIKCNWLKIICKSGEAVFKKVQFTFYFLSLETDLQFINGSLWETWRCVNVRWVLWERNVQYRCSVKNMYFIIILIHVYTCIPFKKKKGGGLFALKCLFLWY